MIEIRACMDRRSFFSKGLAGIAGAGCSACVVEYPMGFDIKEKILAIIRLKDVPPEFFA